MKPNPLPSARPQLAGSVAAPRNQVEHTESRGAFRNARAGARHRTSGAGVKAAARGAGGRLGRPRPPGSRLPGAPPVPSAQPHSFKTVCCSRRRSRFRFQRRIPATPACAGAPARSAALSAREGPRALPPQQAMSAEGKAPDRPRPAAPPRERRRDAESRRSAENAPSSFATAPTHSAEPAEPRPPRPPLFAGSGAASRRHWLSLLPVAAASVAVGARGAEGALAGGWRCCAGWGWRGGQH